MDLRGRSCLALLFLWIIQASLSAGDLSLHAENAIIHGKGANYQSQENRRCIGNWKDVKTWISWDVEITAPGQLEVLLSQAIPYELAGSDYEIHIGKKVLKGKIIIGGGWGDFKAEKVGSISISKPGKYTVKLVPKKLSNPRAFANIRAVVIRGKKKIAKIFDDFKAVNIGKSGLISKDIAIYYPEGYNKKKHGPSFALLKEPRMLRSVPESWKKKPEFFSNGKKSRFTMQIDEGTSLYGTGEVTGKLERRGTKIKMWNTDNFTYSKDNGKRLYQSHPWIVGLRKDGTAFGVLADTTWYSEIDLKKGIKFTSDAPDFRVLVINKKSPQALMKTLAKLTGKIEMPPMWALGFQQCRWSYFPDKKVRDIADGFRSRKIPCDVIWMDIDYMDGFRVFTFDKKLFPDPKGTNDYLHSKGFKGVWMIDPGVKAEKGYSIYDSGTENDVWVKNKNGKDFKGKVWPGMCAFPDYTRPETCEWWAGLYKDFMAQGIDGVWNDMNEPAVFGGPDSTMPVDNWHRGGGKLLAGSHAKYHNVYGMLMVKASREGILAANPKKRPFVLTRSNYLGGHRYAATWTGDNVSNWNHLKMSIPMSITMGLSGQPFNGPDIGGFAGHAKPDLWGHWISLGAFYPFSRAHAAKGTNDKEPWSFGPEVEKAARTALERRYRLMPFFYTLFQEASQNGMPVMRPVFFAEPSNPALRKEDQVFLLGKDLLIIPKWAKNPNLPQGFTQIVSFVGEDTIGDKYQCDVKIRDGAIVPLTKVMQNITEYDHKDLSLMIRLNKKGKAEGVLYEDANDGFNYRKGEFRKSTFTAQKQGNKLFITRKVKGKFKIGKRNIKIEVITDKGVIKKTVKESKRMIINL